MKNIIIYGVNSLEIRRKIEYFLSEEYQIIGYTDSFLNEDIVDNKNFISIDNLTKYNFDYIVIAIDKCEAVEQIKTKLSSNYSISLNKIIDPVLLKSNRYFQKDLVLHIDNYFQKEIRVLIFGLSYSLRGIDKNKLKKKTYDFSWHGLDLYYNYNLLLYAKKKGYIHKIEHVFLVFPYYCFNYDMSCSRYQYETGQIISVHRLKLYHNREKMNEHLIDYEACESMMASKYLEWYRPVENIYKYTDTIQGDEEELTSIWRNIHFETLRENEQIYKKMIDELLLICKKIYFILNYSRNSFFTKNCAMNL